MSEREPCWREVPDVDLRALIARAPWSMAILGTKDMTIEHADPVLAGALGGPSASRDSVRDALGPRWVEAIDRARETGAGDSGTCSIGPRRYDVTVERLGDERVALYVRELGDDRGKRELLHALRNPIYGIRAAVKILLRRDLSAEIREVLGHVETAADEAERCVRALERAQ